ncbi:EF-hand domain-containing protein [Sphingomonas sp. CD22]|uniref:EF-hand domain-containing protein n=1 Tax=Sphingomonas sp. CD22 TaxID=3100214 RepID=UPI002ADF3B6D|nr:EF-hand domain-containing protein [Sphingomonas sp. CD22]MEA1084420.1 EF-hand domain-containing protein [Sphingomonas sp. CD22]
MILLPFLIGLSPAVGQTRAENKAAAIALHQRMDADHDSYVTFAEIRAAAGAMVLPKGSPPAPPADDRFARSQFDLADTDHDRRISLEEAIAGADRAFTEADIDHDGALSAEERGAYAARAVAALQADMAGWKPLPCKPGAACATAGLSTKP